MHGPGALLANRYRLEERVGGGGMGEVWRATDEVLGRTVAVKVMRPELLEEAGFAERFLAEARTMATIKHRGVVAVHDYQGDASGAFLVMEYVDGEALSRRLHRFGRLDPVRTMNLVAQAADALQAAHDKGVVHRDIKPGNLLVTPDDTLVLTDFGIARSAASTPLTATGAVIGTPSYLAPEQVLGQPATPRSDLYALGVVAYECLTGRRPFDGENPFDIAMKRLRESPPTLAVDASPAVLAVVERSLASDPEQRWPSAAALATAARQAAAPGGPAGAPVGGPDPAGDPTKRQAPAGAPAFAPARVQVPQPPRPVAPTRVEHPSPVPPTSPPQPGTPHPGPPHPGPPHPGPPHPGTPYPGTPRPGMPPASAGPPVTPVPVPGWPGRPQRPVTVVLASLLLCVSALGLFMYGAATAAVIEDVAGVAREVYGPDYDAWREATVGLGWLTAGTVLLLAGLFLLLGWRSYRGSRGARAWTFVLGFVALCCCAPSWWYSTGEDVSQAGRTAEFAATVRAAVPWYEPFANRSMVIAVGALLLSMVLLTVPPSNRYFRAARAVAPAAYYYPYPYPYYPYPPRH